MQYTIIILTYKYLEQCFTCDTLVIPSLSQFLSFLAICKKISPTRFGFAHIRSNVTLIVLLEHAENRTHRKSALPWSKACVIASHTHNTHSEPYVYNHTHPSSSLINGYTQQATCMTCTKQILGQYTERSQSFTLLLFVDMALPRMTRIYPTNRITNVVLGLKLRSPK